MFQNVEINVKSALGSIAILTFLILIAGVAFRRYYPDTYIPTNIFIVAALIFGFVMSIIIYVNTDFGIIFSFLLGFIPAFIVLGFITGIGWILLLLDLLILILTLILLWVESHGL